MKTKRCCKFLTSILVFILLLQILSLSNINLFTVDVYANEKLSTDDVAPSVPTGLHILSLTETTVELEWEEAFDNDVVTGYIIVRNGKDIGLSTETKYTDKKLTPKTEYRYQIKACDMEGNISEPGEEIIVVTENSKAENIKKSPENYNKKIDSYSKDDINKEKKYIFKKMFPKISHIPYDNPELFEKLLSMSSEDLFEMLRQRIVPEGITPDIILELAYDPRFEMFKKNEIFDEENQELVDLNIFQSCFAIQSDGNISALSVSGFTKVAGGINHSIALKNDGTVWAWGDNDRGKLGDGTEIGRRVPLQVTGLSNVISIACGAIHSLAAKNDGSVWAWGWNGHGQLGDGTTTDRLTPV